MLSSVGAKKTPWLGLPELPATTFCENYITLYPLGEGGFGKVLLAEHCNTGVLVAVKVLQKQKVTRASVILEVKILKDLQHPNITELLEVLETDREVYLVMEYIRGRDLRRYLRKSGLIKLPEEKARCIFRELVEAVQFCHHMGIIHGNLKPDNILMDHEVHPKLSNFGRGLRFLPGQEVTACRGTLHYCAPEVFLKKNYQGPPLDVWSLGVILCEMVDGKCPFHGKKKQVIEDALKGRYKFSWPVSTELQCLVKGLLNPDPSLRPTLQQVLQHPWLQLAPVPSHHPERIPQHLKTTILNIMAGKGHDPLKVIDAVRHKKYNGDTVTFQLLQKMALKGLHFRCGMKSIFESEDADLYKDPLPLCPAPSSSLPSMRASEPSLFPGPSVSVVQSLGEPSDTVSLPLINICRNPPPSTTYQSSLAVPDASCQPGPATPIKSCQPGLPSTGESYQPGPPTKFCQPSPAYPSASCQSGPATPGVS